MPTQCHKQNTFDLACCRLSSDIHCVCLGSWPFAFHFPFGMSFALVTLAVSFAFALAFGLASSFVHFSNINIKCASRFPRLPRPHVTVDRKDYFLVVCANVFGTQSKMVLQLWWRLISLSAALTVCQCTLHRNQHLSETGRAHGSSHQCHLPASVRGPVLSIKFSECVSSVTDFRFHDQAQKSVPNAASDERAQRETGFLSVLVWREIGQQVWHRSSRDDMCNFSEAWQRAGIATHRIFLLQYHRSAMNEPSFKDPRSSWSFRYEFESYHCSDTMQR